MLRRCFYLPPSPRPDGATQFWAWRLLGIGGEEGMDVPYSGSSIPTLSAFLIDQWGFPNVGIVFSFGGYAGFLFDYSLCGPEGEPRIIWAHSERSPVEVFDVAPTFRAFLAGLSDYDAEGNRAPYLESP